MEKEYARTFDMSQIYVAFWRVENTMVMRHIIYISIFQMNESNAIGVVIHVTCY